MSGENNNKTPTLTTSQLERRKNTMDKQSSLTMESACVDEKTQRIRLLKDHGQRRIQLCFRITERAFERLAEVSKLFQMKDTDYAKAVLYQDLGVWTERLDYRRKKRRQ